MSHKSGGPAFPCDELHDSTEPYRHLLAERGLSKREYFAAKAMAEIIGSQTTLTKNHDGTLHACIPPYEIAASDACKYADALIAELAK